MCVYALSLCERAFGSWAEGGNLMHNRWIGTQLGFGTAVQNIQSFFWGQSTYMVTAFLFLLSFHICQFTVWGWWRTVNSTVFLWYCVIYNHRKHTNPTQQIHFDSNSFHWWTSSAIKHIFAESSGIWNFSVLILRTAFMFIVIFCVCELFWSTEFYDQQLLSALLKNPILHILGKDVYRRTLVVLVGS